MTPTGIPNTNLVVPSMHNDELTLITSRADWGNNEEVSVMVDGNLGPGSSTEELMDDGDVCFELGCNKRSLYKYMIQKRSDGRFTLMWNKFKCLKVESFNRIKHIDEDYIVIIKEIE